MFRDLQNIFMVRNKLQVKFIKKNQNHVGFPSNLGI